MTPFLTGSLAFSLDWESPICWLLFSMSESAVQTATNACDSNGLSDVLYRHDNFNMPCKNQHDWIEFRKQKLMLLQLLTLLSKCSQDISAHLSLDSDIIMEVHLLYNNASIRPLNLWVSLNLVLFETYMKDCTLKCAVTDSLLLLTLGIGYTYHLLLSRCCW